MAAVLIAAGVGVAVPATAWSGAEASGPDQPQWLDSGRPVDSRVDALLKQMTLAEKVGQMDQQLVTTITGTDGDTCAGNTGFNMPVEACMQKVLIERQTGSILAGGTENPIDTNPSRATAGTAVPARDVRNREPRPPRRPPECVAWNVESHNPE